MPGWSDVCAHLKWTVPHIGLALKHIYMCISRPTLVLCSFSVCVCVCLKKGFDPESRNVKHDVKKKEEDKADGEQSNGFE